MLQPCHFCRLARGVLTIHTIFDNLDTNQSGHLSSGMTFMNKTIQILTAGGTIDKIYFDANSSFQVGEPQIAAILKEANLTVPFQIESVLRKDSLEITDDDRELLYQRVLACPFERIIITHGTDTMSQTAAFLHKRVKNKTIVFTGSMEPAKIKSSDAVFNVGSALTAVQLLPPGAFICMNGNVFQASNVRKNHAEKRFEAIDDSESLAGSDKPKRGSIH